jgi:hypothetical protein
MIREEFDMIWHDWLRGVSLIVTLLLLVALYFTGLFTQPGYTRFVIIVMLLGGFGVAGSTCLQSGPPLFVRLAAPVLAAAAAVLAFIGVTQVFFLAEPFASGVLSSVETSTELVVPTDGLDGSYLQVTARPGASPSGKDETIEMVLAIQGQGVTRNEAMEFYKNKKGTGSKASGLSLGRKDSTSIYLETLPAGPLTVRLSELKPDSTLPFTLSLHWPRLPPALIATGLWALFALALVLAVFMARRNHFPFILPYTLVLAVIHQITMQGISPTQPLLPMLGIIIGAGLASSAAGYAIGKPLQLLLRPPQPM